MNNEPKIIKKIGIISTNKYKWTRELNLVQFGDDEPVYDISEWSPDYKMKGNGFILTKEEADVLASMIVQEFFDEQKEEEPNEKATVIDFKTREKKVDNVIKFPF